MEKFERQEQQESAESFIMERIQLPGCTIKETEEEVIIDIPGIKEDSSLIYLKDEKEYEKLSELLKGRKLTIEGGEGGSGKATLNVIVVKDFHM